ncbi:EAL domain-containing protein [Luteimonas sp. MC1572]|uniref:EAL domain-containing protein n=1 Tax=Luteimonas sp. MC1572 TaxID=2799325 RepID=UPI001F17223F|nr:EAL domain-containing protein [Luteimonas sp. MC1572]
MTGRGRAVARGAGWLLAAIALLAPAFAGAREAETLRIGGDADYPPYHFLDEDGQADGFDVALAREVARDLGMEPRFELGAWDDALERLARDEVDIVPMFWSAEREQRFLFTEPILIRHHALFGPRSRAVLDSLDELADVRVAVQHAGLAWEALRAQAGPGVVLVELDNEADTLAAVARGDADYALAPTGIGYYAIHQHDLRDMVALSPPLLERRYVFAARHGRADLVARIDASLERLRASGTQNDLYVEWIGNLSARKALPWPAITGGVAALLVIGGSTLAWRRRRRDSPVVQYAGQHAALLAELQDAIDNDRLGYQFQPKLDLRSGRWLGAELLVRWDHPQRGPMSPEEFVPIAEQARVIGAMSLHLVRCGLRQRQQWPAADPPLHVSVNISANDLADPRLVDAIIARHGQDGPGLMLEITETDVMREPGLVAEAVPRLRAHGIRISVDDFGAGHSSLVNLRRLAPDELKIDRSFVTSLLDSRSDQAIVTAIIGLAHELGATVAAEGIEDDATRDWLAAAGCDIGQGFGIARPMGAAQLATLLRAQA